jgi:hypothetical protein
MFSIRYPDLAKNRGPGFWLKFNNLLVSRRKIFRGDNSNDWRYTFGDADPPERTLPFSTLLRPGSSADDGFRFIIIGDTGEGDRSQYGFLPVIRALKPDFMIINGDIAYPAGRIKEGDRNKDDYLAGFFEPYRNLDIPIWSVPGNHEYYAGGQGREYYETFCTRKFASRWSKYGLRLTPQPGTYWELKEPDPNLKLSVIGIDTGKKGNLDGDPGTRRRLARPDDKQHTWLERRLAKADAEGCKVIVLFHIPALSRKKNNKDIHLKKLHQIIASHKSVRLVVCGHDHNYQGYLAGVFAKYLDDYTGREPSSDHLIEYIVTGGGGAYLTSTEFKRSFWERLFRKKRYNADILYPEPDQWKSYAKIGRKILENMGMSKSFVSRIVGITEKDSLSDMDAAQYLNLLLVEVLKGNSPNEYSVVVTPVFMDNLKNLFVNVPDEAILDIMDEDLPVNPDRLGVCLRQKLAIRF